MSTRFYAVLVCGLLSSVGAALAQQDQCRKAEEAFLKSGTDVLTFVQKIISAEAVCLPKQFKNDLVAEYDQITKMQADSYQAMVAVCGPNTGQKKPRGSDPGFRGIVAGIAARCGGG